MTATSLSQSRGAATTKQPPILERIRSLDMSEELSHLYTPLVMLDRSSRKWVAVGNVETSFIHATLMKCRDADDEPIFVHEELVNEASVTKPALRIKIDENLLNGNLNDEELFERRSAVLDSVTDQLLSLGVISRKHSDMYPVSPFTEQTAISNPQKFALVNRGTAPYLGIDSIGVHLHCYVCKENKLTGVWLAKRAANKSHHPNYWDPTVAGGQPVELSLYENIIKEAREEAGVPAEWLRVDGLTDETVFTDHTSDPLTMTTAKPDGSCMKRSIYYSFDLQVPLEWTPTAVDGEVSEFKLLSISELEEELRYGDSIRPAMRSVLLDFMIRHDLWEGSADEIDELGNAMRRKRMVLW